MAREHFVRNDRLMATSMLRLEPPSWTRLEPTSITGDPAPGLEARVHDPLWLLCRQWQLGEFVGEDAGAPLSVHLAVTHSPVARWAPAGGPARDVAPGAVLEPAIERERPGAGGASGGDRALAGHAFSALLADLGVPELQAALLDRVPHDGGGIPPALAGRVVDGGALASALEAGPGLPDWLTPADPAVAAELANAAAEWLAWYRAEVAPPDAGDEAWVTERLEHRFQLGARPAGQEVVLDAPEFLGGAVDWWAFDVKDAGATLGVSEETPSTTRATTLWASKLRFAGMPADRLWELEDGAVNLGALEVQPYDLARLLFAEFALVSGPDWLVVPVDVPAGSLARVDWVTYTTTFGERFLVKHTSELPDVDEAWRLFTLTGDDPTRNLLFVPSATGVSEGEPLEDVRFLRDEMANLVWAVERRHQDADGTVRSRDRELPPPTAPGPEDRVADAELDYQLATDVPANWFPYAPMSAGYAVIRLRRAEITGQVGRGPARGRLIAQIDDLVDGEVPREGVQVLRVPAVARHADGTWERWVARRVVVGRGEGSSALQYDSAVPRGAP